MKPLQQIIFFSFLVILPSAIVIKSATSTAKQNTSAEECSLYKAIYRPSHAFSNDKLRFELSLIKNEKGGLLDRNIFLRIDAYQNTEDPVSTIRLSNRCSNTYNQCSFNATMGQYRNINEMIELTRDLSFNVILLDKNFNKLSDLHFVTGRATPFSIILPHSPSNIKGALRDKDNSKYYIRFHNEDEVFPDFSGKEVWVFDHCSIN